MIVGIAVRAISLTIASTNLTLGSSRNAEARLILAVSFSFAQVVPVTELSIFAIFVFFTSDNAFSLVRNSHTNVGGIACVSVRESIASTNGIPGGSAIELIPRFTDSFAFARFLIAHPIFAIKVRTTSPTNRDCFTDGHDID